VGSNQYKTRWGPDLPAPERNQQLVDLALAQEAPLSPGAPSQARCGEVWGTGCRA